MEKRIKVSLKNRKQHHPEPKKRSLLREARDE